MQVGLKANDRTIRYQTFKAAVLFFRTALCSFPETASIGSAPHKVKPFPKLNLLQLGGWHTRGLGNVVPQERKKAIIHFFEGGVNYILMVGEFNSYYH